MRATTVVQRRARDAERRERDAVPHNKGKKTLEDSI